MESDSQKYYIAIFGIKENVSVIHNTFVISGVIAGLSKNLRHQNPANQAGNGKFPHRTYPY